VTFPPAHDGHTGIDKWDCTEFMERGASGGADVVTVAVDGRGEKRVVVARDGSEMRRSRRCMCGRGCHLVLVSACIDIS